MFFTLVVLSVYNCYYEDDKAVTNSISDFINFIDGRISIP